MTIAIAFAAGAIVGMAWLLIATAPPKRRTAKRGRNPYVKRT